MEREVEALRGGMTVGGAWNPGYGIARRMGGGGGGLRCGSVGGWMGWGWVLVLG